MTHIAVVGAGCERFLQGSWSYLYQVVVTPGTAMSVDESYVDYLRLPFLLDAEVLRRGVERLAQAWNVYAELVRDNNRPINVLV